MLGFHPDNSLVLVVINDNEVQAVMRMDIEDALSIEAVPPGLASVGERLAGKAAAIMCYTSDAELAAEAGPLAHQAFEHAEWSVLDVLHVDGHRWWSLLCDDDDCCPPEGLEIDATLDADTAEMISFADEPFVSREAMIDSLRSIEFDAANQGIRQATFNERLDSLSKRLVANQSVARDNYVNEAFAILCSAGECNWEELAVLAGATDDIRMRDGLLRKCFDDAESRPLVLRSLRSAIQQVAGVHVAALATVLAGVAWLDGNGAVTQIALDRALEEDPGYSLAHLLQLALSHNVPASVWADSLEAVSYDQCLLGAA